ncbi:hypothetical protein U3516DRAFT_757919 [Neocallimastix sp. 'constans']
MRIYNTQESSRFRQCIRTTEKHDHSVDDDFFDLCQMDYNGWYGGIEIRTIDPRVYALTIDPISRSSINLINNKINKS